MRTRGYAPCADDLAWPSGCCPASDARCLGCHRRPELREELAADIEARDREHGPAPGRLGVSQVLSLARWWAECETGGGTSGGSSGHPNETPEFMLIRCQIGVTMSHVDEVMGTIALGLSHGTWGCATDMLLRSASNRIVRDFLLRCSSYVPLVGRVALLGVLAHQLDASSLGTWESGVARNARSEIETSARYREALDRLRYMWSDVVEQWPALQAIVAGLDKSASMDPC